MQNKHAPFDPHAKERELHAESTTWELSALEDATQDDIPVIDLSEYFARGSADALDRVAAELRIACEEVGFFSIVGHEVPQSLVEDLFQMTRRFHSLPLVKKQAIAMDDPEWHIGGVGYLPLSNHKLPSREKGNLNEAFIVKCDHRIGFDDNRWPNETDLPGFRDAVAKYARALQTLGKKLLPIFATALEMPPDYFEEAFESPLYRLRMTHYPPIEQSKDEFGIAPHVDTSFCTVLAQDSPGLTIFSERRKCWLRVPLLKNAFVVNTGELLKMWTNNRFKSVKHFANNNTSGEPRYSIPFFLNANSDYQMTCIPTCCNHDNPPRYPPISYNQSQAVAQGE